MKWNIKDNIILVIFFLSSFIVLPNISLATSGDVYDVVLFWGQSNMTGYAGLYSSKDGAIGEDTVDDRVDSVGIDNFSKITGIEKEILNNYTTMNHVNVNIKDGTVYEYLYASNSLRKITKDTKKIGEQLETTIDDGNLNISSCSRQTYFALQQSYGTNITPQFAKTHYEKTGHKVIIVMASNGGEQIAHFLPTSDISTYSLSDDEDAKTQYIYETLVEKYNSAIKYLNDNNMTIGNKFYVVFQGEADAAYIQKGKSTSTNYANIFKKVHNNLKNDCGIEFGAIIETGHSVGSNMYNGVEGVHTAQENLINNNDDIILGTSYAYDKYVPIESSYSNLAISSKLDYTTAVEYAKYSTCITEVKDNRIHFTSAALSQIGLESARNVYTYLKNKDYLKFDSSLSIDEKNTIINNVKKDTTIEEIINKVNTNGEVSVLDKNDVLKEDHTTSLKTGDKFKIILPSQILHYTVSVRGDVNGDGKVDVNDIIQVSKHVLKVSNLTKNEYIYASDIDSNDTVNINDVIKLAKHIVNKTEL